MKNRNEFSGQHKMQSRCRLNALFRKLFLYSTTVQELCIQLITAKRSSICFEQHRYIQCFFFHTQPQLLYRRASSLSWHQLWEAKTTQRKQWEPHRAFSRGSYCYSLRASNTKPTYPKITPYLLLPLSLSFRLLSPKCLWHVGSNLSSGACATAFFLLPHPSPVLDSSQPFLFGFWFCLPVLLYGHIMLPAQPPCRKPR